MKKHSKCTASLLMMALCISMASCGSKTSDNASNSTDVVNIASGVNTAQTGETLAGETGVSGVEAGTGNIGTNTVNSSAGATTAALQIAGIKEGGHYENPLFNVYADIPDIYVIYTDEDLGQEYETQEEIEQALGTGNVNYMDLVAQDSMTSENIQIMISHLSSVTEKGRTPDEWLESSMDSFKKTLASQGATDIVCEIVSLKFAGDQVQAISLACTMAEKQIEQRFIYKTAGDYVMMIAVSATQGRAETLLGYFYGG